MKLTEVTSLEDIKNAKAGSNIAVNNTITMTDPMMGYKGNLNLFLNERGEIALDNSHKQDLSETIFVSKTLNVYGNGGTVADVDQERGIAFTLEDTAIDIEICI